MTDLHPAQFSLAILTCHTSNLLDRREDTTLKCQVSHAEYIELYIVPSASIGFRCRFLSRGLSSVNKQNIETQQTSRKRLPISPSGYASPFSRTYAPTVGRTRAPWFRLPGGARRGVVKQRHATEKEGSGQKPSSIERPSRADAPQTRGGGLSGPTSQKQPLRSRIAALASNNYSSAACAGGLKHGVVSQFAPVRCYDRFSCS